MKNIKYIVIISLVLASCIDEVKVPARAEKNILVVEGLITNDIKNQYLKLTLTTKIGQYYSTEPISGAYVEIQQLNGKTTKYRQNINELGNYSPSDPNFVGTVGQQYSIYIKLTNGKEYKSELQKMPEPVEIADLNSTFMETNKFGFQVSLSFKDPQKSGNYYRWSAMGYHLRKSVGVPITQTPGATICCNRCWVLKEEKGVNIFQDNLVNGKTIQNIPVYFSPFYMLGKHFIEINQFSISQNTYQYWRKFKEQTNRKGTIFDPLPAPLIGNIININDENDIALGYFEVSAISKKKLEINDDSHGLIAYNYDTPLFVPEGDCMKAFQFSKYTTTNPPGW